VYKWVCLRFAVQAAIHVLTLLLLSRHVLHCSWHGIDVRHHSLCSSVPACIATGAQFLI
jgi:hypothetical protein